jgi:hypothetical protein
VEVAMMLLLPLLAVALAVPPKRSTSGLGIFLSIVMVVTYHKINQYAEQMARRGGSIRCSRSGRRSPLRALILWMYWTLAHKPGGQPIGALERVFAKAGQGDRPPAGPGGASARPAARLMINLNFFPSKRIAWYMAKLFVLRSLAVLAALVVILMTLDLLGESGKILRVAGNGDAELWRYVVAAHPAADRALPALLGAARHADHARDAQPE